MKVGKRMRSRQKTGRVKLSSSSLSAGFVFFFYERPMQSTRNQTQRAAFQLSRLLLQSFIPGKSSLRRPAGQRKSRLLFCPCVCVCVRAHTHIARTRAHTKAQMTGCVCVYVHARMSVQTVKMYPCARVRNEGSWVVRGGSPSLCIQTSADEKGDWGGGRGEMEQAVPARQPWDWTSQRAGLQAFLEFNS